jgi:hypothetical protein
MARSREQKGCVRGSLTSGGKAVAVLTAVGRSGSVVDGSQCRALSIVFRGLVSSCPVSGLQSDVTQ